MKTRIYQLPGGECLSPQPTDWLIIERANDHVAQRIKIATVQTAIGGSGGGGGGGTISSDGASIDSTGLKIKGSDGLWYYVAVEVVDTIPTFSLSSTPAPAVIDSQGLKLTGPGSTTYLVSIEIIGGNPALKLTLA